MIERFFLDGINAEAGAATVGGEGHLPVDILSYKTESALAFAEFAVARAQFALDTTVIKRPPPAAGEIG